MIKYRIATEYVSRLDRLVGIIRNTIKDEEHTSSECVVVLATAASNTVHLRKKLCEKLDKKFDHSDVLRNAAILLKIEV